MKTTADLLNEALEISIKELLIPFEGYGRKLSNGDCTAYPDPATGAEPYTIGFGSTYDENGKVQLGDVWTYEKAVKVKSVVTRQFAMQALNYSPELIKYPKKLAAIISFCYNIGAGSYRISTLRKRINEEDWESAAIEIVKWDRAAGKVMRGLTRRRQAEANLLLQ